MPFYGRRKSSYRRKPSRRPARKGYYKAKASKRAFAKRRSTRVKRSYRAKSLKSNRKLHEWKAITWINSYHAGNDMTIPPGTPGTHNTNNALYHKTFNTPLQLADLDRHSPFDLHGDLANTGTNSGRGGYLWGRTWMFALEYDASNNANKFMQNGVPGLDDDIIANYQLYRFRKVYLTLKPYQYNITGSGQLETSEGTGSGTDLQWARFKWHIAYNTNIAGSAPQPSDWNTFVNQIGTKVISNCKGPVTIELRPRPLNELRHHNGTTADLVMPGRPSQWIPSSEQKTWHLGCQTMVYFEEPWGFNSSTLLWNPPDVKYSDTTTGTGPLMDVKCTYYIDCLNPRCYAAA